MGNLSSAGLKKLIAPPMNVLKMVLNYVTAFSEKDENIKTDEIQQSKLPEILE